MRRASRAGALLFLLLASATWAAKWPKQRIVQIHDEPESALCTSAAKAVQTLRAQTVDGRLYGEFRDPRTRATTEVQAAGLSFYTLRVGKFATVDAHGVKRTLAEAYYLLDLDNDGSEDMVTLVSGGHGPAGDGDTLSMLRNDISSAPQPLPNEAFADVPLEIGGWTNQLYGEHERFDPAYFIYPFAFRGGNYLLLEGNRAPIRYVVAEIAPEKGIVTRCYF